MPLPAVVLTLAGVTIVAWLVVKSVIAPDDPEIVQRSRPIQSFGEAHHFRDLETGKIVAFFGRGAMAAAQSGLYELAAGQRPSRIWPGLATMVWCFAASSEPADPCTIGDEACAALRRAVIARSAGATVTRCHVPEQVWCYSGESAQGRESFCHTTAEACRASRGDAARPGLNNLSDCAAYSPGSPIR